MDEIEKDDRDFPPSEWEARVEAAYQRRLQGLPPVPWLPRVLNLTALRREVARLRAGVICWPNARMSSKAVADTLEEGIVMNLLEMREQRKAFAEDPDRPPTAKEAAEWNETYKKVFLIGKKLPEAKDPDSEVAAEVRMMHRELRRVFGRPRRRRKRRRKG
jgi:hypothetical protein